MKTANININLTINFKQVLEIVKKLPYKEKLKLTAVLNNEIKQQHGSDKILTHLASEKVLAKDWLLPEEDEAWKDL